MNVLDEHTKSLWMDAPLPAGQRLSGQDGADVAVVGAGIAGLSVAYELAARGRSVIVLDRGELGSGMTARTTAHLATALDDDYKELVRVRGKECARLYCESVVAAIDRAEAIQSAERFDCDFARVDGYWVLAPETPGSYLDDEFDCCVSMGIAVERCSEPTPIHERGLARSLRFPRQARFHPTKYLAGLVRALQKRGAKLYADACVESIDLRGAGIVLKTASRHEIRARDVVVATN